MSVKETDQGWMVVYDNTLHVSEEAAREHESNLNIQYIPVSQNDYNGLIDFMNSGNLSKLPVNFYKMAQNMGKIFVKGQ
jgi:hypothetical protein